MSDEIHIVYLDDEAERAAQEVLGQPCAAETEFPRVLGKRTLIRVESDPDRLLLQLSTGEGGTVDAVILDVDFSHSPLPELRLVDGSDGTGGAKGSWGLAVLRTIKRIDPDIPVVMLTVQKAPAVSFEAAQESADAYCMKDEIAENRDELWTRLGEAWNNCRRRAIYDHEHKDTANQFAEDYDADERRKLATVAYYHFENDLINLEVTRLLEMLPPSRRLRILDIGCGTGRVEEALGRRPDCGRIDVAGVDFAEKMLRMAKGKLSQNPGIQVEVGRPVQADSDGLLHVSLFRATAERLGFLLSRYPDGFDLAVLGFGFLSYVKYTDVLPACPQKPPSRGVVPLLRNGAPVIFSVYNENSAIYERIASPKHTDEELPIAALMDLSDGRLKVGEHYFACEAFTPARMMRFLRQAGLSVMPDEDLYTFPTAHLMMRNSDASRLPCDPEFPATGRFDRWLYDLDRDLSMVIRERGHYVVGVARKSATRFPGAEPSEG